MSKIETNESTQWSPPTGRWSVQEGRAMVAAYRASGRSQRAFAALHGIPAHRVSYWAGRVGRDEGAGDGFVAVAVEPERSRSSSPAARARVEIELRGGRRLTMQGVWEAGLIEPWLRALEATS